MAQRLLTNAAVSHEELSQAARELDVLQTMAEMPGAELMHRKYSAL